MKKRNDWAIEDFYGRNMEYEMDTQTNREEYVNLDEWLDAEEEDNDEERTGWEEAGEREDRTVRKEAGKSEEQAVRKEAEKPEERTVGKRVKRPGEPERAAMSRQSSFQSGYYESIWEERKRMTLISLIAGAVSSLGVMILTAVIGKNMDFGGFITGLLGFTVIISPAILIIWSIRKGSASGAAMGAGVGFLSSLLSFILSGVKLGAEEGGILLPILFFLSFCGLLFYGAVLLVIAMVYAVYIPISDIYYWVRARQERREAYGEGEYL